jgi:hypothetical protein
MGRRQRPQADAQIGAVLFIERSGRHVKQKDISHVQKNITRTNQ